METSVKNVFLLSPIEPQETGTATYFSLFLRDAKGFIYSNEFRITIVVDDRYNGSDIADSYMGIKVIRYSEFCPSLDDVVFLFIANNRFHWYCIEELVRRRCENIYSFVHDPQIFMLMASLCAEGRSIFNQSIFDKSVGQQFGVFSEKISEWLRYQIVPDIGHYLTMCQGYLVRNSRMIVVHSYYAALKLQLETDSQINIPRTLIMRHPDANKPLGAVDHGAVVQRDVFILGLFGWISKSKRPNLVFRAFEAFCRDLGQGHRAQVKLRVVGKEVPSDFNIRNAIAEHEFGSQIEYFDYVPAFEFEKLLAECSLLINLRFPSCGETSGTLAHAETYGVPTVTAAYQSFYEERSHYKITINPNLEERELVKSFNDCFEGWIYNKSPAYNADRSRRKLSVEETFAIITDDFRGS